MLFYFSFLILFILCVSDAYKINEHLYMFQISIHYMLLMFKLYWKVHLDFLLNLMLWNSDLLLKRQQQIVSTIQFYNAQLQM
jgi:hypothetical protein